MLSRLRLLAGPLFVAAGALHFIKPGMYEAIVPPYVPEPRAMVYASGVAEIAGGIGLMWPEPRVRRWAGWWLLATLAAVFPANLHMFLNAEDYPVPGGKAALAARLPVQLLFARWVWAAMRR